MAAIVSCVWEIERRGLGKWTSQTSFDADILEASAHIIRYLSLALLHLVYCIRDEHSHADWTGTCSAPVGMLPGKHAMFTCFEQHTSTQIRLDRGL